MVDDTENVDAALARHVNACASPQSWVGRDRSRHREAIEQARQALAIAEAARFLDHFTVVAMKYRQAAQREEEDDKRARRQEREREDKELAKLAGADLTLYTWARALHVNVRRNLDDATAFQELILAFRPFEYAWRRLERDRRSSRIVRALVQAMIGLIVGVVLVELISNRLELVSVWLAWGFAIVSWLLLDYVLAPVLERTQENQHCKLVRKTLQAAQLALFDLRRRSDRDDSAWRTGWP